jgi:hypothetical protein
MPAPCTGRRRPCRWRKWPPYMDKRYLAVCRNKRMDRRRDCQRRQSCGHRDDDVFPRFRQRLIRTRNPSHNRDHTRDRVRTISRVMHVNPSLGRTTAHIANNFPIGGAPGQPYCVWRHPIANLPWLTMPGLWKKGSAKFGNGTL